MNAATAKSAKITFSLLRLSGFQRLGGACVLVALIWGGVFWALRQG